MSTPNKQLIAAIQRIAEGSPLFTEVRGLLKEIQRRGGIEGLSLKIGADDETGGDCCTDPNETGDPVEKEPTPIDGDAPPDLSGGIGDEWTDCATGGQVQFTPQGFPQPETCKECEPDETWQPGYWYSIYIFQSETYGGSISEQGATPNEVYSKTRDVVVEGGNPYYKDRLLIISPINIRIYFKQPELGWEISQSLGPWLCLQNPSDYCVSQQPEICGDNWQPDSTTNYTLANGCLVASSCDTDATEQAKQCNECITICNSEGQERVICTTDSGGFSVTDPSGQFNGGVYNAQGQMIWQIPAGSTEF